MRCIGVLLISARHHCKPSKVLQLVPVLPLLQLAALEVHGKISCMIGSISVEAAQVFAYGSLQSATGPENTQNVHKNGNIALSTDVHLFNLKTIHLLAVPLLNCKHISSSSLVHSDKIVDQERQTAIPPSLIS